MKTRWARGRDRNNRPYAILIVYEGDTIIAFAWGDKAREIERQAAR